MKLTLELTDEQYAGLVFVTNQNNSATENNETPEEYAQRVFSGVCDDYVKQSGTKVSNDVLEKYRRAPDNVKQAVDSALAGVALTADAEVVR